MMGMTSFVDVLRLRHSWGIPVFFLNYL